MSNEAINLAKKQEEADNVKQQKENLKIVQTANERIRAILSEFNCSLVPVLTMQGNQFRHLVNVVIKPKQSGIVNKEGESI